jgi:toxin ParE1/3/4
MIEIVVSPAARDDLESIWLYIATDNQTAASRVVRTLVRRIETLAVLPRIGPHRPDIRLGTRLLIERPYLILYELYPDSNVRPIDHVEIVRVVDGRRDLRSLF